MGYSQNMGGGPPAVIRPRITWRVRSPSNHVGQSGYRRYFRRTAQLLIYHYKNCSLDQHSFIAEF